MFCHSEPRSGSRVPGSDFLLGAQLMTVSLLISCMKTKIFMQKIFIICLGWVLNKTKSLLDTKASNIGYRPKMAL